MKRILLLAMVCLGVLAPRAASHADDSDKTVTVGFQLIYNPWKVAISTGAFAGNTSRSIAWRQFDSGAQVALDLVAMRPGRPDRGKRVKEYDPPIAPLRYLVCGSCVFLSGVTAGFKTLSEQLADILPRIEGSLTVTPRRQRSVPSNTWIGTLDSCSPPLAVTRNVSCM